MSFIIELFKPGLFDFLQLVRKNPNNTAQFDRSFTNTLKQFADFNVITKGFSGQRSFSNPGRKNVFAINNLGSFEGFNRKGQRVGGGGSVFGGGGPGSGPASQPGQPGQGGGFGGSMD